MMRYLLVCFSIIVVLLICPPNIYPQDITVSLSKKVILRVTAQDGTWVRATVVEGGMLRIKDESTRIEIAFQPIINKSADSNIRLNIFEIIDTDAGEKLYSIGNQEMGLHTSRIVTNFSFSIMLEAIKEYSPPNRSAVFSISSDESTCCITCNGRRYCASCSVQTSCGCCNTNDCADDCQ